MATVTTGVGQSFSGKVGDLVYVQSNGKTYVRQKPLKKPKNATAKQTATRTSFRSVIKFTNQYKDTIIKRIWNKPAKELHMNGYNLFVKTNRVAFNMGIRPGDCLLLHFSTGQLPVAYNMRLEREAQKPNQLKVQWTNQLDNTNYDDDVLMVFFFDNGNALIETSFTRKDKRAVVEYNIGTYAYLFFWNKKLDIYSNDQVFRIPPI